MLKLIFITIILYIVIQHFMEDTNKEETIKYCQKGVLDENNSITDNKKKVSNNLSESRSLNNLSESRSLNNLSESRSLNHLSESRSLNHLGTLPSTKQNSDNQNEMQNTEPRIMTFDKPNPWTKIVIVPQEEFPYFFHIKAKVTSLNDFENWKQVIPNINFDPRAGELIIPSKDEPSALALANLMIINFSGQMTLQNILEKNLIQISIAKAKSYETVQNKLREQIMDNLYGKQFNPVQTAYHQDLALKNPEQNLSNPDKVDFKSDSFTDTFKHFDDYDAWDGNDYSYL